MANSKINIDIKQILTNNKTNTDLSLFQIESLEKDRDDWRNAFEQLLNRIAVNMQKESLEEVKEDFNKVLESFTTKTEE
jgi:hypothetical protein